MMEINQIKENIARISRDVPPHVTLEAAAKTRSVDEVRAVIQAGISVLGYNYVQEAESIKAQIDDPVRRHMIGHLQKNKVKKAVAVFDMIETIDSVKLAERVNTECGKIEKVMDVLIEVNSGEEARKTGVAPDKVEALVREITAFDNIRIKGLMTMGPWVKDPELLRPFFQQTKEIFDSLAALNSPSVDMKFLSMGMSGSYKVAIEEGANIIRLGTILFGPRL